MYQYLSTLRLHDGDGGQTLTVGPKRRVVFKSKLLGHDGNRYTSLRKDQVKRVLSPLKQWWGEDDPAKLKRDPDKPFMSMMMFRTAAKRLLTDAGMLRGTSTED
jgi:hypothetical protein